MYQIVKLVIVLDAFSDHSVSVCPSPGVDDANEVMSLAEVGVEVVVLVALSTLNIVDVAAVKSVEYIKFQSKVFAESLLAT